MMKLTKFELTKIFKNRTVIGALVVSVFLLLGIFYVGYYYSQENMAGRHNVEAGYPAKLERVIKEKYTGDLTDEKVEMIISDYINFWQDEQGESLVFYPFYWYVTSSFVPRKNYDLYLAMTEKLENNEKLLIEEVPLQKVSDKNFKTFDHLVQLGNFIPWTELYKVLGNLSFLISLLVSLVCSLVFADDTSRNLNQLLFTTKWGRSKLLSSKILAGTLASSSLFLLIHSINFLAFTAMNDISGWKSSIQANFIMKLYDFPLEWNHLQVYIWVICLQFVGILFTVAVSLLISVLVKSPLSAFAGTTGLYFLPALLMQALKNDPLSTYLYFFPVNQTNVKDMLSLLDKENGLMGFGFAINVIILFTFLLLGYVIMNIFTHRYMKNWSFR
ncbi:membrane protein [Streptococcus varani]|uniref:Membrane protein n=1 Tax=Streptococcus varani TaxID=1608583 RepID=A0A0E4H3I0_9STRE|nr:ABC transporter permease subunit [Streptococcus varani]CQR24098.1 membrane protein [Streptococcus varani]